MSVIYQPTGRAREYAEWATNLFGGCVHGCVYCYGPKVLHVNPEAFHARSAPRANILKHLLQDAERRQSRGIGGHVLLCFTCDPYQPFDDPAYATTTTQAIDILHRTGHSVKILTKGGCRSIEDLLNVIDPSRDEYGATLTFANSHDSLAWEPRAAPPQERCDMLALAKDSGIRTWVSLEPIVDLDQTLSLIARTSGFVDFYFAGKLNYHPAASHIDWQRVAHEVSECLEAHGVRYTLKADLRKYLENPR